MGQKRLIDARGSFCPEPLMELIAQLKMAEVGDELEILSSDKGSANDIPQWINKVGHEMLGTREEEGVWHIMVRKLK